MLQLENLSEFFDGLDAWVESCDELADDAYRGLVLGAFKYIVQGTPQWSGNLAASWKMTVAAPAVGYSDTIFKGESLGGLLDKEPYSRRNPNRGALTYAYEVGKFAVPFVHVGQEVYITNNAPYADLVERAGANGGALSNKQSLRVSNLPVEMVMAAHDKFSALGELTEARARQMGKEAL